MPNLEPLVSSSWQSIEYPSSHHHGCGWYVIEDRFADIVGFLFFSSSFVVASLQIICSSTNRASAVLDASRRGMPTPTKWMPLTTIWISDDPRSSLMVASPIASLTTIQSFPPSTWPESAASVRSKRSAKRTSLTSSSENVKWYKKQAPPFLVALLVERGDSKQRKNQTKTSQWRLHNIFNETICM